MARGSKRHRQRYLLAGAMFAILLGSCATLPPAKSVTEIRTIAGSWAGDGSSNRQGDGPIQLVISEDGSVDAFLPRMGTNGTAFKAKLWIENGQIRYETAQGTWIGTVTLHEADGRRILFCKAARRDGTDEGEWKVSFIK